MEDNKKTQQFIEFAAYGLQLGQKADLKIKSAETINRKIDNVQEEIQHLLHIPSFDGMSTSDLMLSIQSADLNDQQLRQLHQLMQIHNQLGEELARLTKEIRKITDQTKTIAFMIDLMNAI